MSLRRVAYNLVAKRLTGDVKVYGQISPITRSTKPNIEAHYYDFWATPESKIQDGEIIYYTDVNRYFIVSANMPIYAKGKMKLYEGVALVANEECYIKSISSGSPDGFGYKTKTWATKLITRCNIQSASLTATQKEDMQVAEGMYDVTISRTTEVMYKALVGDRLMIGGVNYKVDIVDDSQYTTCAYICRVRKDNRT